MQPAVFLSKWVVLMINKKIKWCFVLEMWKYLTEQRVSCSLNRLFISGMQLSTDPVCTLAVHSGDVNCVAFNDRHLASCSGDKTVRLFEWSEVGSTASHLPESAHSPLLGHSFYVNFCRFSPLEGSDELVTCSTDGRIILWNTKTGKWRKESRKQKQTVRTPDDAYLRKDTKICNLCIFS